MMCYTGGMGIIIGIAVCAFVIWLLVKVFGSLTGWAIAILAFLVLSIGWIIARFGGKERAARYSAATFQPIFAWADRRNATKA